MLFSEYVPVHWKRHWAAISILWLTVVAIVVGTTIPGKWKSMLLRDIYAFIRKIYGLTLAHFVSTLDISKMAHLLLFGFLGGIC